MSTLIPVVELTDAELDAVAGGALVNGNIGGGLVNVQANDVVDVGNINILNNSEVVKNVGVGVGVAAGILGNAGALGAGQGRG